MEVKIDIDEAKRFMGYGGITADKIDARQDILISELAALMEKTIKPAAVWRVFGLEFTESGVKLTGTELVFEGKDIRKHLDGCDRCVLLCATASAKADELIRRKQAEDMEQGFITDCLGSAAVEAVCNSLERELKERLHDTYMTWRFSPGYGDLPLSVQPQLLAVLDAPKRAGVTCLDSLLMVPSKSVTAVIGLSDKPIEKGRQGCAVCNMSRTCRFRKDGVHCEL